MSDAECVENRKNQSHLLASCSALAQTKYLARHNPVLKDLFFELLKKLGLIDTTPLDFPFPNQQKPVYENQRAKAYWDVPKFMLRTLKSEQTEIRYENN